jgi:plasmid stability protein
MDTTIQIRHVPQAVHSRLKARAALAGRSLSDYLLDEVCKIAERPTPEEIRDRLARLRRIKPPAPVEVMIRQERDAR